MLNWHHRINTAHACSRREPFSPDPPSTHTHFSGPHKETCSGRREQRFQSSRLSRQDHRAQAANVNRNRGRSGFLTVGRAEWPQNSWSNLAKFKKAHIYYHTDTFKSPTLWHHLLHFLLQKRWNTDCFVWEIFWATHSSKKQVLKEPE